MTTPSNAEILSLTIARLKADTGPGSLAALVPNKIFNHVPQETALPVIRARWQDSVEWDTKDSDGLSGYIVCDVWTDNRGDLTSLQIIDRIDAILHNQPLSMTTGQSLILRHSSQTAFTEPDGLTHHAVIKFQHIATN